MLERIVISGAGGQGIILLGKLIARTALGKVAHVTFFPAYGTEVRGGAAHCEVIISSKEISSPCAEQADTLVLMNQKGADEFMRRLARNGTAFVNSSLCRSAPRAGVSTIKAPVSALADKAGNPRSANLVMLGILQQHKPLFDTAGLEQSIRETFAGGNAEMLAVNLKAFHSGLNYRPV